MTTGVSNDPAHPWTERNGDGTIYRQFCGLTKRELLAAMAMQGLLSNLAALRKEGFRDKDIEEFSVIRANGLLTELERCND